MRIGSTLSRLLPALRERAGKRLLLVPVWLWSAFALVSGLFLLVPEIDLAVSRHFFAPDVGFETNGTGPERLLHRSVGLSLVIGNIVLLALLLSARFAIRFRIPLRAKDLAVLLVFLALGPGLIVNALLKENWGRARPVDIVQFGGSKTFTAAFVPSDQGGKSFTSGHAAASTYWILAALLIAPRRTWLTGVAIAYSLAVSAMRIAAGGHFLSDIVTSYFIVAILALALHSIAYAGERSARDQAPP